ncbi:amidase [Bradymonas sediminis]|uniref:Amidase n=1 Tax=Bradymonas sediminis TaxID=1548548 RepID=A0A2Z4FHJ9_9DELT|nr:amidase [Bradymonas sediminis]AWV88481.1 amidase [Bradymonas sediminis]TDP77611.1 amidase [Bradymonas sediminis]
MKFEEYRNYDAIELARMVREKEVSALELIDAAADGILAWNESLNAIIEPWVEDARRGRIEWNANGPLAGVPFLLKDMVEWKGRAMTLGSRLLDGYVAQSTHPLVSRYLDAGLIPLGRTNMSELGLLPVSEPTFYGPSRNPWSLTHTPGGSSGGSAAAVAAGIVPVANAADGGGSIRIPASACGLFGLKPTRGLVVEPIDEVPAGFVSQHCVSRTVRDSALLLDLSAGRNPGSRWRTPKPSGTRKSYKSFADAATQDPDTLRVGVMYTDFMGQPLHPACRAAVEKSAKLCEELGHEVVEIKSPIDGLAFRQAFSQLWATAASFFLKRVRADLDTMEDLPRPLIRLLQVPGALETTLRAAEAVGKPLIEPLTRKLAIHSDRMAPSDLWLIWQQLNVATAAMTHYFDDHDILLTSTLCKPPVKVGHYDDITLDFEELEVDLFNFAGLTPLANSTGLPSMSLPLYRCDQSRPGEKEHHGLPIGTQFYGPHAEDAMLLSLAGQFERAFPWDAVAPLPMR